MTIMNDYNEFIVVLRLMRLMIFGLLLVSITLELVEHSANYVATYKYYFNNTQRFNVRRFRI